MEWFFALLTVLFGMLFGASTVLVSLMVTSLVTRYFALRSFTLLMIEYVGHVLAFALWRTTFMLRLNYERGGTRIQLL